MATTSYPFLAVLLAFILLAVYDVAAHLRRRIRAKHEAFVRRISDYR